MCGVAGIIDASMPTEVAAERLPAMVEAMACRGPDARGSWIDSGVAIGHTRNSVIDLEGGRQPMLGVSPSGQTIAVLDYVGEVYNYRALRSELAARGHRFRTESDTEVVLQGYVEWGIDVVGRLEGIFGFAIWDVRRGELVLARDRIGVKPIYYAHAGDRLVFGSEPKAILASGLVSPEVDLDGMRTILSYGRRPGATAYAPIQVVKPGHVLRFTNGLVDERPYWTLTAREHRDDLATTITTIRDLLATSVADQTMSDVPWGVMLSGGLDSSLTSALAAATVSEDSELRSYSLDFDGHVERFKATRFRPSADQPFALAMSDLLGTDHRTVLLGPDDLADDEVRAKVLHAWDEPVAFGDSDSSLYLFCRAIKRDSTMVLSGEGADEIFGGHRWFHDAAARSSTTFPWLASGIEVSDETSLLHPDLLAELSMADHLKRQYEEACGEVPRLAGESASDARGREVTYCALTRFLPMLLDRMDRMSMASALEVRVPFLATELVEYAFNIPWSLQAFDGREKALLRAAGAKLVLPEVLDREKSNYPMTQDPRYTELLRRELATVAATPGAAGALLNLPEVARTARADGPASAAELVQIEQVLRLCRWIEDDGIRFTGA